MTFSRHAAARCVLIGQSGAGRTLFARRFAAFLGAQGAAFTPDPAGQRAGVALPGTGATLELLDATGLPAGIPPEAEVRAAAARALRALLEADICLHVADAAAVGAGTTVGAVDRELAGYARERLSGRYALLAGKVDHPLGRAGMFKLQRELGPEKVIPVSALTGTGFREVRAFLTSRLSWVENLTQP